MDDILGYFRQFICQCFSVITDECCTKFTDALTMHVATYVHGLTDASR